MAYLLVIDQGTSSTRAIIFSGDGKLVASHRISLVLQHRYPGWVEFDVDTMWQSVVLCVNEVIAKADLSASQITAMGITNQRETTVVWDRRCGDAICPAIVWQDRRTVNYCDRIKQDAAIEALCHEKTGLRLDPYFSATKIAWILDNILGARELALKGKLAFGTIDCFLLWHLSGGRVHATDATNAARTLLYNIKEGCWDDELLALFSVPASLLPKVCDSNASFGETQRGLFGAKIPITGVLGDQQAAALGNGCVYPGMVKSTYGTGCFVLLNTGEKVLSSRHRLLSTIAYQISGQVRYALEGSIFIAGAAVKWLRESLQLADGIKDTQLIASSLPNNGGVYFVPALTGLGAPCWEPNARGAMVGLSLETGAAHLVRAALEAVCYQTRDLLESMQQDFGAQITSLRVDGGMTKNDWLLQFLADICDVAVERPRCIESSALGAAMMAGLGCGLFDSLKEVCCGWQLERQFLPEMLENERQRYYAGWRQALQSVVDSA